MPTTLAARAETPTGTSTLPEEIEKVFQDTYAAYSKAAKDAPTAHNEAGVDLANLAAKGKAAGWPMRILAAPCTITPERLRQIVKTKATNGRAAVKFPTYEKPSEAAARNREPRPPRPTIGDADRLRIKQIAKLARDNTGSKPLGSRERVASEEFSRLILKLHSEGVTWQELADATDGNHKVAGLRGRIARWRGYLGDSEKPPPPSIKPYQNKTLHPVKAEEPAEGERRNVAAKSA